MSLFWEVEQILGEKEKMGIFEKGDKQNNHKILNNDHKNNVFDHMICNNYHYIYYFI